VASHRRQREDAAMRRSSLASVVALAFCLPGCCSMARLLCGPDRSPWVSVDFSTPELAARTLFEALRRDDPEVVYLCLADDYRRRLSLDAMTARLAWQRLREAHPGLHLAGYAEVPPAERHGDDRATVTTTIEGVLVQLRLVRQGSWDVRYRRPDGTAGEIGSPTSSWAPLVDVQVLDDGSDRSRLTVRPLTIRHDGLDEVPLDAIESIALERRWKVEDLRTQR
jgi:hypothetical protein